MSTAVQRMQIAASIVKFEARYDGHHHIAIYKLPAADGGGDYEVAGINNRYHPDEAANLAELINADQFEKAEQEATEYIALMTDHVALWTSLTAIESYLRDSSFNRGPRGAARILQRSLQVEDDGGVGPITLSALRTAEQNPLALLESLRGARERYEREVVKRDENSIFWTGLVNRWNKALETAKSFLTEAAVTHAVPSETTFLAETKAEPVVTGHSDFYADVICKDARFTSVDRVADIHLLEPNTRAAVQAIITDAKQLGIALMVFETYRSKERQTALFDQGASTLKNVGVHHYGLACDLVKDIHGQPSWKGDFNFLGTLARQHGLVWGGTWGQPDRPHSFVDSDHVQRITLGRQAGLFSGAWYPEDTYDPYKDGAK